MRRGRTPTWDVGTEGVGVRVPLTPTYAFPLLHRRGDKSTAFFATTVHKSQGAEFEHTALVLPDDTPAVLTRELLYTGITRARRWLALVGTQAAIEHALAQRTRRYSGLAERLGQLA